MWARSGREIAGFTLIELMVTVAIIGVLSAVAIPACIKYTRKAKTAEARQFVRKMYDGARQYYMDQNGATTTTMQPLAPQFPNNPVTDVEPAWASGVCCAVGGTQEKCQPTASWWDNPLWKALHFSMDDPHYYGYGYAWYGALGPYAQAFDAEAFGDLNCDGARSDFNMFGYVLAGQNEPRGNSQLFRVNELE